MLLTIALIFLLSIFSTAVMLYISIATPIGPWIAPTLALCAMLIMKLCARKRDAKAVVSYATCASSIGGILATAVGFSYPTIYFLDPELFTQWMQSPLYFSVTLSALSLCAGAFGLWIGDMLEYPLIQQGNLPFPIGQLICKIIAAQNSVKKGYELLAGFVSATFVSAVQDGIFSITRVIPKHITIIPALQLSYWSFPSIAIDIFPFLWAIGFITGHVIAIPLVVGATVRYCCMEPIGRFFFPAISSGDFSVAFCSGIVLFGAVMSFVSLPQQWYKALRSYQSGTTPHWKNSPWLRAERMRELSGILILCIAFFAWWQLPILSWPYLIIGTGICTYQIAVIAGKIGLAQLGRFATFVMVPAIFLFNLTYVQIIFFATFVEIAGGVAADVLFGRRVVHDSQLDSRIMRRYQWLGLVIAAAVVGIIFWILAQQYALGSSTLSAARAKSRALLVHIDHFNIIVLLIGSCFGLILKWIRVNPLLVLGGILMPLTTSIGLIIGGFFTVFTADAQEWYPFWSGIFAANSLWMLIRAFV